ncbi:hypothetical protein AURDEDRAFT_177593 [Auricularia subglabra TFB-10046 SS5]|uniref:Uncharacterized protein n=1 Tax=Auricularia subglabra (strain TFB-10046 / SS5) TaxID=717982 RepID=J0WNB3_AURST|nr:hypothetical protein AURDEDRAFT_177593 [Auricularia subglabra TFB-10046 SS5]
MGKKAEVYDAEMHAMSSAIAILQEERLLVLLPPPGQRKSASASLCLLLLVLPVPQGVQVVHLDLPRVSLAIPWLPRVVTDLVASHCLPSQHQPPVSLLASLLAPNTSLPTKPTLLGTGSVSLTPS